MSHILNERSWNLVRLGHLLGDVATNHLHPSNAHQPRGINKRMADELRVTDLVCVLCGELWVPAFKNRCECGGMCTWGIAKGAEPMSWKKTEHGYVPRMPGESPPPADS